MKPFVSHKGLVAPLDRMNIDTDLIIPKQFLKSIHRTGFGDNLFDQLRYLDEGQPGMDNSVRPLNNDFILNKPEYSGASILLTRDNFGCGSSREHAPWALLDYGFRALIAPSFADIFFNNCFKNGILPIVLPSEKVEFLFQEVAQHPGMEMEVDLRTQQIRCASHSIDFEIEEFRKHCLLNGLDDIGLTLEKRDLIATYEEQRKEQFPWLFEKVNSA